MNGNLPSEEKAALMRFHLAFQAITRLDLTAEQKALIWESLSLIKADSYARTDAYAQAELAGFAERVQNLFPGRNRFEIFGNIGGTKDDVAMLQKYEDLTPLNDLQRKAVFRKST